MRQTDHHPCSRNVTAIMYSCQCFDSNHAHGVMCTIKQGPISLGILFPSSPMNPITYPIAPVNSKFLGPIMLPVDAVSTRTPCRLASVNVKMKTQCSLFVAHCAVVVTSFNPGPPRDFLTRCPRHHCPAQPFHSLADAAHSPSKAP